jgi:hypothetical protein
MSSFSLLSIATLGLLIAGAALHPTPLAAQDNARPDSRRLILTSEPATATSQDAASAVLPVGPRAIPAGVNTSKATAPDLDAAQNNNNVGMGPNLALMGVGAAGVVIGLLVGGDGGAALAIGGGVLGLIGFYRFLR